MSVIVKSYTDRRLHISGLFWIMITPLPSPGRWAKYFDQRVCMFVCLFVCPVPYLKSNGTGQTNRPVLKVVRKSRGAPSYHLSLSLIPSLSLPAHTLLSWGRAKSWRGAEPPYFKPWNTQFPNFNKFSVHVTCGRGSVLRFFDGIMFSHNGANGHDFV